MSFRYSVTGTSYRDYHRREGGTRTLHRLYGPQPTSCTRCRHLAPRSTASPSRLPSNTNKLKYGGPAGRKAPFIGDAVSCYKCY